MLPQKESIEENAMELIATKNDKKMNFALPSGLKSMIIEITDRLDVKAAPFIREALIEKIRKVNRELIKQELRIAYKANYDALKEESEELDYISVEGIE